MSMFLALMRSKEPIDVSMLETLQPVQLRQAQLQQAIAVMGRAFVHDPFLRYLAPDETQRKRLTPEFVGIVVKYCTLYGEVWTLPSVDGIACWLPPGKTSPTFGGMVRTGMLTMPLKFGWSGFQRFNAIVTYTEILHKQFASEPHWYLWGLGVEPAQQGKGLGGILLQPVLSKADAAGQPCYLETQNESNLTFYHKYGFDVVSGGTAPKSSLRVWAMLRQPRPN
jgi:GNAT superfamily N-acetyltransferase